MLRTLPKKKITFPEGYTLIMRVADGKYFVSKHLTELAPDNLLYPMHIVSEDNESIILDFSSETPLLYSKK